MTIATLALGAGGCGGEPVRHDEFGQESVVVWAR